MISKANWLADTAEEEQLSVIEDPRVISSENLVYEGLAAQATPFITTIDEVSLGAVPEEAAEPWSHAPLTCPLLQRPTEL